MDPFSYLSVLTSVVVALGVTRVLVGVGKLLQTRGQVKHYWVHLIWALNLFLWLTLNWWMLSCSFSKSRWRSTPT